MKTFCTWPQSGSAKVLTALLVLTVFGPLAASRSEAQSPTYALSVSTSSNHSGAIALQGATLSGNVYVFTSSASNLQNYDPSGITRVCHWLDNPSMTGMATHCESYMPYDFISSVNNTTTSPGNPWNTAQVANGAHTITQTVTRSAGGSEVDTAAFSVQNATLSLSATSLAFGSQLVGTPSAAKTVTLTNNGTAPVTFTGATTTGDYAVSNNTCAALSTKGASCAISVTGNS